MKATATPVLSVILLCFLVPVSAQALPPWKPKFKQMFVDSGPKSLQEAFADKVIGSCKTCHVNGREKTVRNPFGIALDKQIAGNAGQRLKAAKGGDEAKAAMQAKLDKELLVALNKVLKLQSPSGGGTYGERIKAGKLPFVPAQPNQLLQQEKDQGFQLLFNGKNLDGWKAQMKTHFRVEDGKIIADGTRGRSMLYFVGKDGKASFNNFELRLQVLTHKGANSGIYFRTRYQARGYPDNFGYEAQIANTHKNPQKTGSIFRIRKIAKSPTKDNEWVDYHIIANGRSITITIDGNVVTTYKEPEAESKRKPSGHLIGLQCHDPAIVEFRSIRIRPLGQSNN